MTKFNEDTRVKIPSILHLCRLGYEYLSLKDAKWNLDTNIFPDIFKKSIIKINPDFDEEQAERLLQDTSLLLDNEDLGKAFYKKLITNSGTKLIDFDNFENNTFNIVTELTYKNGDEEFRPDIILLINGMPLAFIEVKKPNNRDGIIAERESKIFDALQSVKSDADLQVLQNTKLLNNENYFSSQMMRLVIDQFRNKNKIPLNAEASKYINNLVVNEYINEFYGIAV